MSVHKTDLFDSSCWSFVHAGYQQTVLPSCSMAGPPSEASLHALVDKAEAAISKGRYARASDLYKRAVLQAVVLYSHSLVIVELQSSEAETLRGKATHPGVSVAEQRALYAEAWALVQEGMEVVSRRHAGDTLGYNKCRPDEAQYITRRVSLLGSLEPAGLDAAQRAFLLELATSSASCFGVSVAMQLAHLCLHRTYCRIPLPPLAAPERGLAEQFVIRVLDYLASIRAVTFPIKGEPLFVHTVQQLLALPGVMETSFRAALETRWTSPDVVASLHMRRGGIEQCTDLYNDVQAESDAAQRADIAEHGLLVCALPGCDKQEATVREFKVCSACRAVAYCSAEHGGLHWAWGHKHECNDLKAAGAKPARAM